MFDIELSISTTSMFKLIQQKKVLLLIRVYLRQYRYKIRAKLQSRQRQTIIIQYYRSIYITYQKIEQKQLQSQLMSLILGSIQKQYQYISISLKKMSYRLASFYYVNRLVTTLLSLSQTSLSLGLYLSIRKSISFYVTLTRLVTLTSKNLVSQRESQAYSI